MRDTRFLYRCRLCGGIDDRLGIRTTEAKVINMLCDAIFDIEKKKLAQPMLMILHNCCPGKIGVADLIGSEERKDKM